jgi:hypothetical protein
VRLQRVALVASSYRVDDIANPLICEGVGHVVVRHVTGNACRISHDVRHGDFCSLAGDERRRDAVELDSMSARALVRGERGVIISVVERERDQC